MQSLASFIPIDRRLALVRGEPMPDRAQGTALFMDISGFTELTEALTRTYGAQRGAEELTRHLNKVYDTLIATLERYGASVVGFSGDAITCWLDETAPGAPTRSDSHPSSALRSVACALAMQEAVHQIGTIVISADETITINVKISICEGPVRRFQVGDPTIRYLDTLAGATLDRLAAEDENAQKDEVILDAETAHHLGGQIRIKEWRKAEGEEYALVGGLNIDVSPTPWSARADELPDEQLRPWLLPFVFEQVQSGRGEFLAQLRPVVSVFIRFGGINYDTDPDACEKLDAYICWVQRVVARYEGTLIELVIGDKGSYLYAAMGTPIAHDDDPLRALAAARELRTLPPELYYISRVQIGISRGTMRVGPYGSNSRRTYGAMGNETNVAARLMEHATAGQIIVSEGVARLTEHRYQFRALGAVKVKGKTKSVDIFALVGMQNERSVVGGVSTPARRRAPLVGRTTERATLREHVERLVHERRGGTVIIQGEAGIGKSRLVEELLEQGRAAGATVILAAGDAVEQSAIYFPWRAVFSQVLELDTLPEDASIRRAHVLNWLESGTDDSELARLAPLLNAVLPLGLPDNERTAGVIGGTRAQVTRDLLANILRRSMHATPLVIVIEDAHWLDSASWALLERVALLDAPLLLAIATRPFGEAVPPEYERLRSAAGTQLLLLEPLTFQDVNALVEQGLGVQSIPPAVLTLIHDRAEGNPFFSEELAYALRDAGVIVLSDSRYELAPDAPALETLHLPDTVQGVISSRIDRLQPSQQLAIKVASVIGRVFAFRLLCDIHPVSEATEGLSADLDVLARLDLTSIEMLEPDLRYIFKHVITQQVAYDLLLYSQKQQLHRLVGEWYERTFPDSLAQYYPLLSYHWCSVVQWEPAELAFVVKAIDYLRKAGTQAIQANANQEAVGFLTQALKLVVERLPMSGDRLKLELGCLIDLAPALIATRGYADPTLERNFGRARLICEQLGLVPQLFPVLNGLNFYYMVRVNLPVATELADRLQAVAKQLDDPLLLRPAANALVATRFFAGKISEAVSFLEMVASDIPLEQERALATQFGHNPTQAALVIGGTGLWVLGFPDRALATSSRGLVIARDIAHAHSQAYASQFHTNILGFIGDYAASEAQSAETVAISKKFGFPVWAANGAIGHGWSIAIRGRAEEGILEIRQGIAVYQKLGIDLGVPFYLGFLADVYRSLGQSEPGLEAIERALELCRRTGELWVEAELCRLKGELLLLRSAPDVEGAQAAFAEAIDLAQSQQARSWELRATMSQCRLLQNNGSRAQARTMLTEIYNRFSEGWDTQDLKQARTMLSELEGLRLVYPRHGVGAVPYLVQVWSPAVVYVKIGDWGNVRRT